MTIATNAAPTNVTPVKFSRPSPEDMHRRMCAALINIKPPMRIYPDDGETLRRMAVQEHVDWLKAIFAAVNPVADFVADEAVDNLGGHRERVEILEGAQADFLAAIEAMVDRAGADT